MEAPFVQGKDEQHRNNTRPAAGCDGQLRTKAAALVRETVGGRRLSTALGPDPFFGGVDQMVGTGTGSQTADTAGLPGRKDLRSSTYTLRRKRLLYVQTIAGRREVCPTYRRAFSVTMVKQRFLSPEFWSPFEPPTRNAE
jgi:hypothetical protein